MKVQIEELSPIVRRLTVELEPAAVDQALAEAYRSLSRTVKVKGFRPGKAPRRLLEQSHREQVEIEVAAALVERSYPEAVGEHSLAPVAPPVVENDPLAQGQPFRYRARLEVKPILDPQGYLGLPMVEKKVEVTDLDLDAELEKLRQSLSALVPIEDRAVGAKGDWALIDYDLDLPAGSPGLTRNREVPVEIAPGTIIAGFVRELEGVAVGASIEVPFTFASDYKLEALRGRATVFHVTLKSLRRRETPALDDEMVKDLDDPDLASLADLRARLREQRLRELTAEAAATRDEALQRELILRNPFEVPPSLVERLAEAQLRRIAERLVHAGVDPREVSLDEAELRESAARRVKAELLLEAIADKEGIAVSDEEIDAFVEKLAKDDEAPLQKVRAQFTRAPARRALRAKLREDKTLAFLRAEATIQKG